MARVVNRDQVPELMQKGAKLIEVLPAKEYRQIHLPAAINIPLTKLKRESTAELNRNEPVIVYCYDYQ